MSYILILLHFFLFFFVILSLLITAVTKLKIQKRQLKILEQNSPLWEQITCSEN